MKVDPGNGVNFLIMRTFHVLIVVFLLGACARRQPVPQTVRPVKVTTAAGAAVSFVELSSPFGHDAFLLEAPEMNRIVDGFLRAGESL